MREQGSHTPPDILDVLMNFFQKVEITILLQNFWKNSTVICEKLQSLKNGSIFSFHWKTLEYQKSCWHRKFVELQEEKQKSNSIF